MSEKKTQKIIVERDNPTTSTVGPRPTTSQNIRHEYYALLLRPGTESYPAPSPDMTTRNPGKTSERNDPNATFLGYVGRQQQIFYQWPYSIST